MSSLIVNLAVGVVEDDFHQSISVDSQSDGDWMSRKDRPIQFWQVTEDSVDQAVDVDR